MLQLTARQTRFVEEYGVDGNAAQAAFRAGYSARCAREQGYRLLTKAHIREALGRVAQKTAKRVQIEKDRVLLGLLQAIDTARAQAAPMAMIAGWREIARLLQMYEAPPSVRMSDLNAVRQLAALREMSDEELLALMTGG